VVSRTGQSVGVYTHTACLVSRDLAHVSERLLTADLEGLGNSRETRISIFIIWVEILAQGLLNVGQASYPFEATFDELLHVCRCVCVP